MVENNSGPTVLLIGASTVREDFDEKIMTDLSPSFSYANGGTTGGSVYTLEVLTSILGQYNVKPDCIVLGVNSRMLVDREIGLNGQGYTDFMDYWHGKELVHLEKAELQEEAYGEVLSNTVFPLHRLSRQLNTFIRYGLYRTHLFFSPRQKLARPNYELRKGDLKRLPTFNYSQTEPQSQILQSQLDSFRELGLYNQKIYARERHIVSLRRTLDQCLQITSNVIVIMMPEHSAARSSFGAYADEDLACVLGEYEKKGCFVLKFEEYLADNKFRDVAHLLPSGREVFSKEVAGILSTHLLKQERSIGMKEK